MTGLPLEAYVSGTPASQRLCHVSLVTTPCVTCSEPRGPRGGGAYLGAGVIVSGRPDGLGVAPVTDLGQSKTSKNLTGKHETTSGGKALPPSWRDPPALPCGLAACRHGLEPQPPPVWPTMTAPRHPAVLNTMPLGLQGQQVGQAGLPVASPSQHGGQTAPRQRMGTKASAKFLQCQEFGRHRSVRISTCFSARSLRTP